MNTIPITSVTYDILKAEIGKRDVPPPHSFRCNLVTIKEFNWYFSAETGLKFKVNDYRYVAYYVFDGAITFAVGLNGRDEVADAVNKLIEYLLANNDKLNKFIF